ncbi:hypothetical protein D3C80_1763880 [compost metagenome]
MQPDAESALVDLRGPQAQEVREARRDACLHDRLGCKRVQFRHALVQRRRALPEVDSFIHTNPSARSAKNDGHRTGLPSARPARPLNSPAA